MANTNTYSLDLESGSSQYASIADASQTGLDLSGDFTIEFWIKAEDWGASTTTRQIVTKYQGSLVGGYAINTYNNGGTIEINANIYQNNDTTVRDIYKLNITSLIPTGEWHHVAITCDISEASATTFEFFIDGKSRGNGTAVVSGNCASIYNNSGAFYIGADNDTGRYFDGKIDDVRVWSDVRTPSEIQANMDSELVGNETGLVGYWKLNNDYTDETSNSNDLTASGSPVFSTDYAFETENTSSLDLELSSSQYAYITDANQTGLDLSGDFTFEAWIKLETAADGSFRSIISKYGADGNRSYYWSVTTASGGVPKMRLNVNTNGSTNTGVYSDELTLNTGTWYHLAVAYDLSAGQAFFYQDSVAKGSPTGAGTSIYNSSANFEIGKLGSNYLDTKVDDVRVWNDIRTSTEISNNYQAELDGTEAGLVAYWKFNNNYVDETASGNSLTPSGSPVFAVDAPFAAAAAAATSNATFMGTNF